MQNGSMSAAWILILIGAANILYGIYRAMAGREDNVVLFGIGATGVILGAALLARNSK